jgi:hypothetical protein
VASASLAQQRSVSQQATSVAMVTSLCGRRLPSAEFALLGDSNKRQTMTARGRRKTMLYRIWARRLVVQPGMEWRSR